MNVSKQWLAVGAIVAGLATGGWILTHADAVDGASVGAPAPDYRLVELATGDSVSLRDRFKGHVTLINIWATWCEPCRREMPSMEKLYQAFKDRGFRIEAVSIDQGSPEDVKAFAKKYGLTFEILQDKSGDIQTLYRTTGVPESFIVDRNGVVVRWLIGGYDWTAPVQQTLVDRLLAVPGA
ncbi:MAG TPA: TlpA disulfide reductase family protein [Gemmatimonadales bacterium]|nr:TlpA disulfide reductase family protein [Gemmatimonadales bacterium]